jgi:hypothetical protein
MSGMSGVLFGFFDTTFSTTFAAPEDATAATIAPITGNGT